MMLMWGFQFDLGMSEVIDVGQGVVTPLVSSTRFEPALFFFGSCEPIGVGSIFFLGAGFHPAPMDTCKPAPMACSVLVYHAVFRTR